MYRVENLSISQGDIAKVSFVVPLMHDSSRYQNVYGVNAEMGVTIEEASLWAQHKSKIFVVLGLILLSKAAQYLFKAMRQGERVARDHDQQIVLDHHEIPMADERIAEGEADSACYVCMENKRRVAF